MGLVLDRNKFNNNNIKYKQNVNNTSCNNNNFKSKNINKKKNINQLLMQKSSDNLFKTLYNFDNNIKRNKVEIKSLDIQRKRKRFQENFINKIDISNKQKYYKSNNDNYFNTSRNSPYKNNINENTYCIKPNKTTIIKEKTKIIKLNLNKKLTLAEEENNNNIYKKKMMKN